MFRKSRTKPRTEEFTRGLVLFFCLLFPNLLYAAAPTVGTITPSSGTTIPNTAINFTCIYADNDGWTNLKEAYLLISASASALSNAAYLYYDQNSNKLYVRNDANTAWVGGYAPGSSNVIQNTYVKLNCASSTITGSSTTMTVKWNITFKTAYSGKAYKSYLYSKDDNGNIASWTQKGTYTVNSTPTFGTLTPSSGTFQTDAAQNFTTTYLDADGWQNIQYVYFLVNTSSAGSNCLYAYYNQNTNLLYLRNNANTAWLGGFAPGSANTIENSYAKLYCNQTTVAGSGTTMTVYWAVVFKSTFTGAKQIYLYVNDDMNVKNGFSQKGNITIQAAVDTTPPTISSVNPADNSLLYSNQTVTIIPVVIDNDPSPLSYQFGVDNVTKQAWSSNATFNWTTTSADAGKHIIKVEARDDGGIDSELVDVCVVRKPIAPPN